MIEFVQPHEKRNHIYLNNTLYSVEVEPMREVYRWKVKPMSSNKSKLASVSHPRDGKTMWGCLMWCVSHSVTSLPLPRQISQQILLQTLHLQQYIRGHSSCPIYPVLLQTCYNTLFSISFRIILNTHLFMFKSVSKYPTF